MSKEKVICELYHEEGKEVYTVSWEQSGKDASGAYGISRLSKDFETYEEAKEFERALRHPSNYDISYDDIRIISNFKRKRLSKDEEEAYFVARLQKLGYKISK